MNPVNLYNRCNNVVAVRRKTILSTSHMNTNEDAVLAASTIFVTTNLTGHRTYRLQINYQHSGCVCHGYAATARLSVRAVGFFDGTAHGICHPTHFPQDSSTAQPLFGGFALLDNYWMAVPANELQHETVELPLIACQVDSAQRSSSNVYLIVMDVRQLRVSAQQQLAPLSDTHLSSAATKLIAAAASSDCTTTFHLQPLATEKG
jgi:hypothetical protein